jgi:hypothetical protein
MSLAGLTETEHQIVCECLRAAVKGPFFPMGEFQTLFGLEHQIVADIAFSEFLDETNRDVKLAINNALNWLTGYPHKCGSEIWSHYISVSPEEVRRILKKWKGTATHQPFSRDVFKEMM